MGCSSVSVCTCKVVSVQPRLREIVPDILLSPALECLEVSSPAEFIGTGMNQEGPEMCDSISLEYFTRRGLQLVPRNIRNITGKQATKVPIINTPTFCPLLIKCNYSESRSAEDCAQCLSYTYCKWEQNYQILHNDQQEY